MPDVLDQPIVESSKKASGAGEPGGQAQTCDLPHMPIREISVDDFALTVEDAEHLKAEAAVLRASVVAAAGGRPLWCAQTLAQAVALETVAARATELEDVLVRGNGGEVVLKVAIDAPWKQQEVAKATSDAPSLVNAEASLARLRLAHDADSLSLAVDLAERSSATSPVEQMLAHQIATAHTLAMRLAARSETFLAKRFLNYPGQASDHEAKREQVASIEAARLAMAAARMMETTARGAITLDRLKNGLTQTIVVQQQVDVQSGGQALVNGAIQVERRRGKKGKCKC